MKTAPAVNALTSTQHLATTDAAHESGEPLGAGEVRLWWALPQCIPDRDLNAHAAGLPEEEQAAARRFVLEADRRTATVTRVIVRRVLAAVGGVSAAAWRFQRTPMGRPIIANAGFDWLTFSVSHTRSLVVCAVARRMDLGVDIEPLGGTACRSLAIRYFAPPEAEELQRLAPALQNRRFLQYWTLKEAYLKARGLGLSVPLDSFWFHLDPGEIRILSGDGVADEPRERWRFISGEIEARHLLAVAAAPPPGAEITLRIHCAHVLLSAA